MVKYQEAGSHVKVVLDWASHTGVLLQLSAHEPGTRLVCLFYLFIVKVFYFEVSPEVSAKAWPLSDLCPFDTNEKPPFRSSGVKVELQVLACIPAIKK